MMWSMRMVREQVTRRQNGVEQRVNMALHNPGNMSTYVCLLRKETVRMPPPVASGSSSAASSALLRLRLRPACATKIMRRLSVKS